MNQLKARQKYKKKTYIYIHKLNKLTVNFNCINNF